MIEYFTPAVEDSNANLRDKGILHSGSIRHLVNDESLLEDARDCEIECVLPDGDMLKLTKMGSVSFTVKTGEKQHKIRLTKVHLGHPSHVTFYLMACLRRKVTR